jgi:hypothetical protein
VLKSGFVVQTGRGFVQQRHNGLAFGVGGSNFRVFPVVDTIPRYYVQQAAFGIHPTS